MMTLLKIVAPTTGVRLPMRFLAPRQLSTKMGPTSFDAAKRLVCTGGVRMRFAPSPTGSLHVGGARTALSNQSLCFNPPELQAQVQLAGCPSEPRRKICTAHRGYGPSTVNPRERREHVGRS